ncbi:sigma-E processing peptidase SpoIIGA [Paenibacillus albicereus]|uniref:Sporulation sigma-E factor-processing peptidase n=1 Tax=Paenibacillus albicereus TaxID=2726185 RepID=A0A6H2H3W8_9BACL|nr:sigma-E processing peptidase SpoIIGA [Paenibacillus albicereus]QJC54370.1 sigma-E processing peptidase SpoIIGA [Paenibacillus albicereus]
MAVYVDVLFLRELLVDGSMLLLTGWIRGVKAKPVRVLGAASIGAAYVVLMLFPPLSFLYTVAIKAGISLAMLYVAFGFRDTRSFLRFIGAFYAVNFVAAGAVLGLHYMLLSGSDEVWRSMRFLEDGMAVELQTSLWFVVSVTAIGLYLMRSVVAGRRQKELVLSHLAEVIVRIGASEHRCTGLVDTGNQLYDPLSRTPVMVMEASLWEDEIPPGWMKGIRDGQVDRLVAELGEEEFKWQDRIRLVPYRGINKGTQFMLALKPDGVVIEREGSRSESSKVLIGLDGGKLVADGSYRAIIHPSLVESQAG